MNDLVEFLRIRLRDDESLAQVIIDGDHWHGIHVDSATEVAVHVERHDPARVLREVEAKRRIMKEHGPSNPRMPDWSCTSGCRDKDLITQAAPCQTLRLLALPYVDHPDYREEWRP